ncbi:MAG: Na+/H+ antiporter subunit E [Hydrogenophaga sp.]|uniref:Na+/H+ antiporter subunit E n=1 Tax=Hydrogenophaga sp. TaxID=1904254 RepID=UPI002ABA3765|nr:Na+/H+ antiporter subunit E [Hydrogenophaga sp.]MDZ4279862.1 Na+/H+ antiporter subunit E [Hydrogenophaga sp.]
MTAPVANQLPARKAGWLAHPVLSVLLGASWLALSHSLEPVHLLSALLIGLIVPRLLHSFLAPADRIDWIAAVRLSAVVLKDIVLSNITVARLVLGPMSTPQPAWLPVPLATDHPRVNALFATIITTTPGTVSCVVDEQRREILVHALNCDDAQAMIDEMKNRYEAPLMQIFGQQARTGSAA